VTFVWLYIWLRGRVYAVFLFHHASVLVAKSKELTFKLFQILVKFHFIRWCQDKHLLHHEEWRIRPESWAVTKLVVFL